MGYILIFVAGLAIGAASVVVWALCLAKRK